METEHGIPGHGKRTGCFLKLGEVRTEQLAGGARRKIRRERRPAEVRHSWRSDVGGVADYPQNSSIEEAILDLEFWLRDGHRGSGSEELWDPGAGGNGP